MSTLGDKKNINIGLLIAIIALLIAIIQLVTSVTIPEIRTYFGLEKKETNPIQESAQMPNPKSEVNKTSKVEKSSSRSFEKPISYIGNTSFMNSDRTDIAVLIIEEKGNTEGMLSEEFARRYTAQGMRATSNLFNSQFVKSGAFNRFYQGDMSQATLLKKHVDKICLGTVRMTSRPSTEQPDMIVVEAILNIRLLDLNNESIGGNDRVMVAGTGWSEEAAKNNAIQKLISKTSNQ